MNDNWHVLPVADLVAHEDIEDCVCGPRVERIMREDGSDAWLIVHNALDGRE